MGNRYFLFTALYFILLTLFSLDIPFFWDGTFFSETAVHFFVDGFGDLLPPASTDTGCFPIYPAYHALMWKLFGRSLVVSHLIMLPVLLGAVYEYFRLAQRFLDHRTLPFAMLLLACEPAFVTQSVLMGYDLLIVWFFLLALNSLLDKKEKRFALALLLLSCSSIRGMMLGAALLAIDLAMSARFSSRRAVPYVPAILFVAAWGVYHQQKTGWLFFSPAREDNHESFLGFSMMLRQAMFIFWRINDAGRIFLWIFLFMMLYLLRSKTAAQEKLLLKILLIPLLVLFLFMAPLANPVGPKYFIVVFLCLNIGVCFLLQEVKKKGTRIVLGLLLSIALLSGNFWTYPERYGNAWDASLKVLPYFELRDKMDEHIASLGIQPEQVGTQYPFIADKRFSHLSDTSFQYTNVWMGPLEKHAYFLHSNVINTDIPEQIKKMENSWILLHEEKKGMVFLALYKNPYFNE